MYLFTENVNGKMNAVFQMIVITTKNRKTYEGLLRLHILCTFSVICGLTGQLVSNLTNDKVYIELVEKN